jgi:hypothetical protein
MLAHAKPPKVKKISCTQCFFQIFSTFNPDRLLTAFLGIFEQKSRWRAWKTTWLASPWTGLRAAQRSANFQRTYGLG